MGGAASGRVTQAGSGINGAQPGEFGGEQSLTCTLTENCIPAHDHSGQTSNPRQLNAVGSDKDLNHTHVAAGHSWIKYDPLEGPGGFPVVGAASQHSVHKDQPSFSYSDCNIIFMLFRVMATAIPLFYVTCSLLLLSTISSNIVRSFNHFQL